MGLMIYVATPSDPFMPADYGLKAGDIIQSVVVGGGGGGGATIPSSYAPAATKYHGGAGYQSSFGAYCTAAGGSGGNGMLGGGGLFSGGDAVRLNGISLMFPGGGGAGGYVPGVTNLGGDGGCFDLISDGGKLISLPALPGLAGTASCYIASTKYESNGYGGVGSTGSYFGGGAGIACNDVRPADAYYFHNTGGGGGYGAGGGGASRAVDETSNGNNLVDWGSHGGGGGSGYVKFGFHKLTSQDITAGIPITVGGGGGGASVLGSGGNGSATGGGIGGVSGSWSKSSSGSRVDINEGGQGG